MAMEIRYMLIGYPTNHRGWGALCGLRAPWP
ncbi:hypothetical protein CCACVL1_00565 [Corchorus capsularis]|uniref:Uncharacterized protein n=1 Tax=Corchorus capsularis TaxID=210143 RepID=A0A1R3KW61_COCAP|nr:hypothetical protein CCACVL1_00565 [Corchorus capsularis]